MTTDQSNPVRYEEGKWWWYDEVWADRNGPYDTETEAKAELAKYCRWLAFLNIPTEFTRQEVLP